MSERQTHLAKVVDEIAAKVCDFCPNQCKMTTTDKRQNCKTVMQLDSVADEIDRLQAWVSDLQFGMYINCVYCGHRYGPKENTPVSMADILKQHVEQCPKHPMSKLKAENARLQDQGNRMARQIERLMAENVDLRRSLR